MEPLLPSEIARLVYGYLKKEKNDSTAEFFLKSSPHLTECYQMFQANRSFNIKVNGLNLHDIFDIFGTMCSMINERTSEARESKTIIEKLKYLLDMHHMPIKEDKCVGTELNVDKCIADVISTNDKSTNLLLNVEANKLTEVLEIPFSEIVSNNISKLKEIDVNGTSNLEKNSISSLSPCLSSTTHLIKNCEELPNFSKTGNKESSRFQVDKHSCSTPTKKIVETKNVCELSPQSNQKNVHNQYSFDQTECQQIPEATSLDSMPGLSKEDRPKDNSIVIDTGELVDTFLNDQSLLDKIADTINKSIEGQRENDVQEGKILDPPTLEKVLDSTQSDPQIRNILDEFLVFNVDDGKKISTDVQPNSIKSRLRSAKKKDDAPIKSKKNNLNTMHITYINDKVEKIDNNIVLIHNGNIKTTFFENFDISNQVILQQSTSNTVQSFGFDTSGIEQEEDYSGKANYVKIAPKITPMLKSHQAIEKRIFPKRKKLSLEEFGIKSKFKKTNITSVKSSELIQPTRSIIIEVPNQKSFEVQAENSKEIVNAIKLPEISSGIKTIAHDTPHDRLKPPKNKSMSTPRRRSTHIRCLDFSTPQPKNNARDQARSKLFNDSPKKCEKILEESSSSPLPKLQADWGLVNGFESIVRKECSKHWDTEIREMVGAGVLTSDADGRKTRKKKTPRKKIKSVNDKNNSDLVFDDQNESNNLTTETTIESQIDKTNTYNNDSLKANELKIDETNKLNISDNICNLDKENCNIELINDQKLSKEQNTFSISSESPKKNIELCEEQLAINCNSLKDFNNKTLLKEQSEFSLDLETPNKIIELYKKPLPVESNSLKILNNSDSLKESGDFPISLETPNKISEMCEEQFLIESNSLKNSNSNNSQKNSSEFPISLETPNKITELCKEQVLSNSVMNICNAQNNLEKSENNTKQKELENNLNLLNMSTMVNDSIASLTSKSALEIKDKNNEKDSNFLKTFNSHSYLEPLSIKQPENKISETNLTLKKTTSLNQIEVNNSNTLNSPSELIQIQPIKHNLIETPIKCDDAAVDVPETPISKLIREYDPSKLVTPLPCTPEHCEDSLTETPLTKIFRETSYLNRPPISPFPPTPGNSRSVDTLFVPLEQDNSIILSNTNSKISSLKELSILPVQETLNSESLVKTKAVKIKSTVTKTKPKLSTKTKLKNDFKKKSVEAKKKQVYESVKVELFGSEISSSSSADELLKTKEQPKQIVINKKNQEEEKKSGFKPIPKRKLTSTVVNGTANNLLDENNEKNNQENLKKNSSIKQTNKSRKSMVHFDDPVEKCFNLSKNTVSFKPNNENTNKIQIENADKFEQLVGLSRYLNKPPTFYEHSLDKKKKTVDSGVKASKLNNSDSNINYSEIYDANKFSEKSTKASCFLKNKIKTHDSNQEKSSRNYETHKNKTFNEKKINTTLNKSHVPLDRTQFTTSNDNILNHISISKKMNDSNLNKSNLSETTTISHNSLMNNTSCVTVGYNDESKTQLKVNISLNNMEYLKKQKIYEVITEDGEREMVFLNLSEAFTFLDIPSELCDIQSFNPTTSPLKINNTLDVTPEIEAGELEKDNEIVLPVTSTPKDTIEKKIEEKQNRARRSPSFWEDSVHNYPSKYRDDRYRESNHWRNKNNRSNRYDNKYRPNKSRHHDERLQFGNRSRFPRNHHVNIKREFRDDVRDKERFKHKEDKRRNYRDYNTYDDRKGRDRLDEPERLRMSQSDSQKLNRAEDIVKKAIKRPADRTDHKTPAKVSKVEHQRLLKNVDVDDFLSVVHGRK